MVPGVSVVVFVGIGGRMANYKMDAICATDWTLSRCWPSRPPSWLGGGNSATAHSLPSCLTRAEIATETIDRLTPSFRRQTKRQKQRCRNASPTARDENPVPLRGGWRKPLLLLANSGLGPRPQRVMAEADAAFGGGADSASGDEAAAVGAGVLGGGSGTGHRTHLIAPLRLFAPIRLFVSLRLFALIRPLWGHSLFV